MKYEDLTEIDIEHLLKFLKSVELDFLQDKRREAFLSKYASAVAFYESCVLPAKEEEE